MPAKVKLQILRIHEICEKYHLGGDESNAVLVEHLHLILEPSVERFYLPVEYQHK